MKTHESRLNHVFQRVGNIIEDQWSLQAGIDEIKELQRTMGTCERVPQTPIKEELVSPVIGLKREPKHPLSEARREISPEPFIVMVSWGIESLYAWEGEEPIRPEHTHVQPRDQETATRRLDIDRQSDVVVTPGEAWIRNRNRPQRFRLGTEEALERWHAASDASRERRGSGRQRLEPATQNFGDQ